MIYRSILRLALPLLVAIGGVVVGLWAFAGTAHGVGVAPEPLTITKIAADGDHFLPGQHAYYQIEVCNPNDATVYLDNITDTLPSGFSYNSESASGLANFDPDISGQTLTWLFDGENVGGLQCATLNFSVTISADEPLGMYCNQASVDWGTGIAETGATAPMQVLSEGGTEVTPTCSQPSIVRSATPTVTATVPATATATETPVPPTATVAPPTATATQPGGGTAGVISAPNTGSGSSAGGPSMLRLAIAVVMVAGGAGAAAYGFVRR